MTFDSDRSLQTLRDTLRFDERGFVAVVTQDADTGEVLMLAFADREAVQATLETRQAHYHSRSRGQLWRKGATSGHVQDIVDVRFDCDGDALLYRVRQTGAACHTGNTSCFYRSMAGEADVGHGGGEVEHERDLALDGGGANGSATAGVARGGVSSEPVGAILDVLEKVVRTRLRDKPEGSYVAKLHQRGLGYVAQKVIEEAGESAVAALEHKNDELIGEAADLMFHLSVLLVERGLGWADVTAKLAERHAATPRRA